MEVFYNYKKHEFQLIIKARTYAEQAHKGQFYGVHEYLYHLDRTFEVAEKFDLNVNIKAACYLHDTLEDTDVKYYQLKKEFGLEIAEMVYDVTDELGRNRRERKEKTYPKTQRNQDAILLKVCDRIANINECLINGDNSLFEMYKKEDVVFRKMLQPAYRNLTGLHKIWRFYEQLIETQIKST